MDEADILGDRIGIMKEGKLECLGSSMFLKQKFAVGYILKINKLRSFDEENAENLLNFLVENLDASCSLVQENHDELVFNIPNEFQHKFKELFNDFDSKLETFKVKSYSIQMTSLAEVFEKVGNFEK